MIRGMLVLASTSRHRQGLLERAGIGFTCVAPSVDEEALKDDRPARELAMFLARAKGESIARTRPTDIVVGCDQICLHEGRALGKPGSSDRAEAQLARLSGQTHELVTAMAVFHRGEVFEHLEVPRLTMRVLSKEQISRYVRADQPLDCAGSYRLESRGITLFERIDTSDHTAIIGLPILALVRQLAALGAEIP
jgi:septum formation protein